jgi:hypothetical protein
MRCRAGIAEIGLQPVHVGDAVSLVLQIEFDAAQVQVEALDSDFFKRGFVRQKGIKLYAPPIVTQEETTSGVAEVLAVWPFQILDCPDDLTNCSGDKTYELPVISVSYQLIDESGEALNNKTARFRPWPGKIVVTPALAALSGHSDGFAGHFPGGAYPAALPVRDRQDAGLLAMFAGILLLAVGVGSGLQTNRTPGHASHTTRPASRWEKALGRLRGGSLPDEQWADMLRRCTTWYCLDELGCNPFVWLNKSDSNETGAPKPMADFRVFFVDVLAEESVAPERRKEFLDRFTRIAEQTVGPLSAGEDIA